MNHLLASLPAALREALAAQRIELPRGAVLQEIHEPIARLYFPESAMLSAVVPLADGVQREAGVVGCEGLVGFDGLRGASPRSAVRWLVQVPGRASMVELATARAALATPQAIEVVDRIADFARAFLAQVMSTAACNASHSAEARLARWLLLCLDRVPRGELMLTHEWLAQMLGMARPRVTLLARTFQAGGLIRYSRGTIYVVDRQGLAETSCECYAAVRRTYRELLPYVPDCSEIDAAQDAHARVG